MAIFKKREKRGAGRILYNLDEVIECGFTPLTDEPTIVTACERIARHKPEQVFNKTEIYRVRCYDPLTLRER